MQDGGFQNVTVGGSGLPSNISNTSTPWKKGYNSPQWSGTIQPACDKGVVSMWGNKTVGESIHQNGLTFTPGSYTVKFTARFVNPTALSTFVRLKLATYNGTGAPSSYDPPGLASANINSSSWQTYSFSFTTAAANSISLHPENDYTNDDGDYVSWIQIDNICIEKKDPCSDCAIPNTNTTISICAVLGGSTTVSASAIGASTGLGNGWTLKRVPCEGPNPCKWIPGGIIWQAATPTISIPSSVLTPGCYVLTHYVNRCSKQWNPKDCLSYQSFCFTICDNKLTAGKQYSPGLQTNGAKMKMANDGNNEEETLKEVEQIKN